MRRLVFFLFLICHVTAFSIETAQQVNIFSNLEIDMAFNSSRVVTLDGLADLVDQEDRINKCIDEYIKTQSKSYNKIVQNNLYDLIYNFGRITSKIYGKKQDNIDMPYEDKIEILAKAQCEAYNAINKSK